MSGSLKILGIMTGTSCDGMDASLLEMKRDGFHVLWNQSASYPANLRKRVLGAQRPGSQTTLLEVLKINRDLGEWYGRSIEVLLKNARRKRWALPDVVANHGQTIAHFPEERVTLQTGDAAYIVSRTGLTSVSHFREGDLAAGGQGAPLVPLYHWVISREFPHQEGIAIQNLGGIGNVTYIGAKGRILAFDTGPGNAWIDAATEKATRGRAKFDRGGRIAGQGEVDMHAVEKLMKMPFFRKAPPKSTGRDEFPFRAFQNATRAKGADAVATATAVTIESMAVAFEKWILSRGHSLSEVYLCGGGAKNPAIVAGLQARIRPVRVRTIEELGLDSQFLEAQAFAVFGFYALVGIPIGGAWTGAQGFGSPGHILPGKNWKNVLKKLLDL